MLILNCNKVRKSCVCYNDFDLLKGGVYIMNGVSQDSQALREDASYIEQMASNFQTQYNNLFEEMDNNLSAEANEAIAWWGPQAGLFLQNFNQKKDEFESAHKNIVNMANNLVEQADAWDRFEAE